jgi:hypothetical protein
MSEETMGKNTKNDAKNQCINELHKLTMVWYDPVTWEYRAIPTTGKEVAFRNQVIFLNAFPINAFMGKNAVLRVMYCGALKDIEDTMKTVINNNNVINFISHESTAKALGLSPNKALYSYREGDVIIIVTLNKPLRNVVDMQVTVNDLDVYLVKAIQ